MAMYAMYKSLQIKVYNNNNNYNNNNKNIVNNKYTNNNIYNHIYIALIIISYTINIITYKYKCIVLFKRQKYRTMYWQ